MTQHPTLVVPFSIALCFVAACAESVSTHRDTGTPEPDAASAPDAASTPDAAATDTGNPPPDSNATTPGLVVNEIQATGTEFVELLNTGSAPIDLSALRFTDDDAGTPNAAHATAMPSGVVLHASERFVVVTNVTSPAAGLSMGADCMISGVDRCLQVSFGLSNASGDAAYVLASDDSIVASAAYPAMSAGTGESYCRLPDGSGAFTHCSPSPALPNTP